MFIKKLILVFFCVMTMQVIDKYNIFKTFYYDYTNSVANNHTFLIGSSVNSTNNSPEQEELPCIRMLNSYKAITGHLRQIYDEFYEELKAQKLNPDLLNQLEINRIDFEGEISEALEYYEEGAYLLQLINNAAERLKLCRAYINMSIMIKLRELKELTLDIKAELTKFLNQSNLKPANVTEQIEKRYHRILKMIDIIDVSYRIGKYSYEEYEKNVKEFAAKVEEEVKEEIGEQKIVTKAAKDRVYEVLRHLKSGNETAASIVAKASEIAANNRAETQKTNVESDKTSAEDVYWSWGVREELKR